MPIICPTITANSEQYESYILDYTKFAKRLHIDLSDGKFTLNETIGIDEVYWPWNIPVDLHLMYKNPGDYIEQIIALAPSVVIIHPESEVDVRDFSEKMKKNNIKTGLALMPDKNVESLAEYADFIDYILIFSGKLGFYGGVADLSLTSKINDIKKLYPGKEIAWDGGINDSNVASLIKSGVDVLNVGGFIAGAEDKHEAFNKLIEKLS
jgi:ribulose-phosphate 3-epimerase